LPDRAPGLLKNELRRMGSLLLRCADDAAVPAGRALAVDRDAFADAVEQAIDHHPLITLRREEVQFIPAEPTIIASGPLTSEALAQDIEKHVGDAYLYFYDALSPIVNAESIDMSLAFRASRYDADADGDYINCPMNRAEYERFVAALLEAETIQLREFEKEDPRFFEGCLPIEQIARRGPDALAFGPMRPVGIKDPRTGRRPHAVVQLRQDNLAGTLYNIVGFQTNLRWPEQKRILRLIPGLEAAEFYRLGQMHRNTFINSPMLIEPSMAYRHRAGLWFAGQIVGVEGYVGNVGTGLLAGLNAARYLKGQAPLTLPETTMMGALCHYVSHAEAKNFQPMKANFGILPPLVPHIKDKRQRSHAYAERALRDLEERLQSVAETV
ncbi:MAG: methylenetetrahydrofolate--tRNA-(uracil(54)-C(5))-methyltransferase (FADH(2)-oxidizing) TrmFO, partial [Anaerolineales bacterium]